MAERPSGLAQRAYLIGREEREWLESAASKTKLTQADFVRLAVLKLKKELGGAGRLNRDKVLEYGQGVGWAPVKRGGPPRKKA